jgi:hypothetical protein
MTFVKHFSFVILNEVKDLMFFNEILRYAQNDDMETEILRYAQNDTVGRFFVILRPKAEGSHVF